MAFLLKFIPLFLLSAVLLGAKTAETVPTDCTESKMDLAFLVDVSGSICGDVWGIKTCADWEACVAFIRAIVNDMAIGENDVRVAMTIFGTKAWIQWNLSTYYNKADLLKAIDNLPYLSGTTNTIDALDSLSKTFSPERGDRPGIRNKVILITDGKPRNGRDPYTMDQIQAAVKRVTDQEIRLLAVGVTNSIDMETLKELSSPPRKINETVFLAKDYQSLSKILKQVESETCKPHPTPIFDPIPDCTTHKMDLAFLVDESGSICNDKGGPCDAWHECVAFIHTIVNDMIIGENDVRVALTLFQTSVFPQWSLDTYSTKSELLKAIDNLHYNGGTTNTPAALDNLTTTFSAAKGDRPDVRNVAILITDGRPRMDDEFFPMDVIRAAVKRVTDQGIRLLCVGVTNSIDMDTLKELSSAPHTIGENVFFVKNYQSLQKILKQLEAQTCVNSKETG